VHRAGRDDGRGEDQHWPRLASLLHLPFLDADVEIEKAANLSIPEIFSKHGEAHFREGERRVVARLLASGPAVIATGGGAFMCAETRELCRMMGVTVWLKADASVLMDRVRKKGGRPLLDQPEPDAVMRRLLAEREPVYATADLVLSSRDGPQNALVAELVAALDRYLANEPALAD
jgi:shikimate kinase